MIRINTTIISLLPTAPFPGTDYRLIQPGEKNQPGDDYFDPKSGQWLPDDNITDEPFDPAVHLPARRKRGPVYKPYDMESIPLPLVIRHKAGDMRCVVHEAGPQRVVAGGYSRAYESLLHCFTHEDGSPCGVLVDE